jgi:hypothetical protein
MRAGALGLVLAAAGTVVCSSFAVRPPAWRVADNHRAVQITLHARDLGKGWSTVAPPKNIDLGELASSSLTSACSGPVPATKAAVDLEVTGASLASFSGTGTALTSIVMLFKTSTVARMQMPAGNAGALKRCIRSELQQGVGRGAKVSISSVTRRPIDTGSPHSYAFRVAGNLGVAGISRPFLLDMVLQNDGRGLAETAYFSLGTHPDEAVEKRLARLLESRLARYAS